MTEPADPMTLLASAATEMHEMFLSYVKAGFSRKEALYLMGQYLTTAAVSAGQSNVSPGDTP